ncbi:hypothetical protein EOPP23_16195 [Endozoicomonas sp. OPT23]|uniref:hypothetical protein n=1 Tax=Endozoicomonas sp. OPT23 TaxID=2072845 RepID=UPI00129A91AB|nr:hypothetical protein [Endozoicomonas sp. OPT23]MRI34528.1 hypothetical protein [Endozoicomonas sp. OPT23]
MNISSFKLSHKSIITGFALICLGFCNISYSNESQAGYLYIECPESIPKDELLNPSQYWVSPFSDTTMEYRSNPYFSLFSFYEKRPDLLDDDTPLKLHSEWHHQSETGESKLICLYDELAINEVNILGMQTHTRTIFFDVTLTLNKQHAFKRIRTADHIANHSNYGCATLSGENIQQHHWGRCRLIPDFSIVSYTNEQEYNDSDSRLIVHHSDESHHPDFKPLKGNSELLSGQFTMVPQDSFVRIFAASNNSSVEEVSHYCTSDGSELLPPHNSEQPQYIELVQKDTGIFECHIKELASSYWQHKPALFDFYSLLPAALTDYYDLKLNEAKDRALYTMEVEKLIQGQERRH